MLICPSIPELHESSPAKASKHSRHADTAKLYLVIMHGFMPIDVLSISTYACATQDALCLVIVHWSSARSGTTCFVLGSTANTVGGAENSQLCLLCDLQC